MRDSRDDFSADKVRRLGERVGLVCSNPKCRAPTKGAHTDGEKAANVGKACHVHAAAPGGPRFDPAQTPEQRASMENGVWLCSNCATLIDSDPARFPAELLRAWKTIAEQEAKEQIGRPAPTVASVAKPAVELTLDYKKTLISGEIHRYALVVILKNVGTKRIDDWYIEVEFPTLLVQEVGTGITTLVEGRSSPATSLFRTQVGDTPNVSARKRLLPGDAYQYGFPYRMDSTIYYRNLRENLGLFEAPVKARAYVNGELAAEAERRTGELQCF
jgi:hypothetical protein